jgi:hypothetical protein
MPGKGTIQDQVKKKLNIKWVNARELTDEAIRVLHIDPRDADTIREREDDILEEACEIFEDLTPEEQNAMRIPESADGEEGSSSAPDWKKKAMATAAKREKEWADQVQRERDEADEKARRAEHEEKVKRGEILEDGYAPEEFHITRTVTKSGITVVQKKPKQVGRLVMEKKSVACVIM